MVWIFLTAGGALIWVVILLLPWRPWSTRQKLEAIDGPEADLADVTALIPARNEAETIASTITGLKAQVPGLHILIIDDRSTDDTTKIARRCADQSVTIVEGKPLPEGWSGKLWALEQGFRKVTTPLALLIDADIELKPGILPALIKKMKEEDLQLVSLMAAPQMNNFWERWLMPAFIYFFKLLYPFHLSNTGSSRVSAAAGGCILIQSNALNKLGGFKPLSHELIDDCALARGIKSLGYTTWIGLTRSAYSNRPHRNLSSIWRMVARSAFTQLRHSNILLILLTLVMIAAFWVPLAGLFFPTLLAKLISMVGLLAMMTSYLPTLKFYNLSKLWSLTMPVIGTLYLAMTWTSAIWTWRGEGAKWKGRSYSTDNNSP